MLALLDPASFFHFACALPRKWPWNLAPHLFLRTLPRILPSATRRCTEPSNVNCLILSLAGTSMATCSSVSSSRGTENSMQSASSSGWSGSASLVKTLPSRTVQSGMGGTLEGLPATVSSRLVAMRGRMPRPGAVENDQASAALTSSRRPDSALGRTRSIWLAWRPSNGTRPAYFSLNARKPLLAVHKHSKGPQ